MHGRDSLLEQGKRVKMTEQQVTKCYGFTAIPIPCAAQGEEVEEGKHEEGVFSLLLISHYSESVLNVAVIDD